MHRFFQQFSHRIPFFFYGTLLTGNLNGRDGRLRRIARLPGCSASTVGLLFDLGAYPGMITFPKCRHRVFGKIVYLTPWLVKAADGHERVNLIHPTRGEYRRETLGCRIHSAGRTLFCACYIYNRPTTCRRLIIGGDYAAYRQRIRTQVQTRTGENRTMR